MCVIRLTSHSKLPHISLMQISQLDFQHILPVVTFSPGGAAATTGIAVVLRNQALVKGSVKWTFPPRVQGMENYSGCKGLCSLGRTGICWPLPNSRYSVPWRCTRSHCLWRKMEKGRMQHDSRLFRNLRIYMEVGRTQKEAYKSSNCWKFQRALVTDWAGENNAESLTQHLSSLAL